MGPPSQSPAPSQSPPAVNSKFKSFDEFHKYFGRNNHGCKLFL